MILSYDLVKIYNLVSKIKLKLFGEVNIGLAALTQWLIEHSAISQDADTPFDYVTEINLKYDPIELYDEKKTETQTFATQLVDKAKEEAQEFSLNYRYFISTKKQIIYVVKQHIN